MFISKNTKTKIFITVLALSVSLGVASASAQDTTAQDTPVADVTEQDIETPVDILPAAKAQEQGLNFDETTHTHPPVKLTPDKSELLRLDRSAGSIIIGNPNHLSILADSSKTLVLVPRAPGATHFTVLDTRGNVIMQRHAIVASPKEKYVRIRRSCAGGAEGCQPTSVFYCPDTCHEIMISGGGDTSAPESSAFEQAIQSAVDEASGEQQQLPPPTSDDDTE